MKEIKENKIEYLLQTSARWKNLSTEKTEKSQRKKHIWTFKNMFKKAFVAYKTINSLYKNLISINNKKLRPWEIKEQNIQRETNRNIKNNSE